VAHTLILLRHAKSDWSGLEADVDRPLARRGLRQAPGTGKWIAAHVDRIDQAVVSTAVRARTTWELVAAELGVAPPARLDDDAYTASADELLAIVRSLDERLGTVVLVGHNPGLEDLAESLTGDYVHLPTSALAVIDVDGPWADVGREQARLHTAGRPPVMS
jgi:phosphohistidine phosphatase